MKGRLPVPTKTLSAARRYARQVVKEGADEAWIVENRTGIILKRYDPVEVRVSEGICPSQSKKAWEGKERIG